jgi:hypothetical protein
MIVIIVWQKMIMTKTRVNVILINNNYVASVCERTISTERPPLVGQHLRIEGCRVVSAADKYGRNLGFLDRSRCFFFQVAPHCTDGAEWTPFQTHYFSENPVVPGIETGTSESIARDSDH